MKRRDLPVLPTDPGCYLYRGDGGRVLYVGKAKNLKNRVLSYFSGAQEPKTAILLKYADSLDFIVTASEADALLLENNLIKEHKPQFNVQLKDDKTYPFIRLTNEEYPMLMFTRRRVNDGSTYFGPYPSAGTVRKVLDVVHSVVPLRQNSGFPFKPRRKPCLRFHMEKCLAPCVGNVTPDAYAVHVRHAKAFLEGRVDEVVADLTENMHAAAKREEFELAKTYRDRLQAIERMTGYQSDVDNVSREDLDFLGVAVGGSYANVQLIRMRRGRVVGRDKRFLHHAENASELEVLERYMADYYPRVTHVPPLVLVPDVGLDRDLWQQVLGDQAGRNVEVRVPQRGDKVDLVEMARRNAEVGLETDVALLERRGEAPGVKELKSLLELAEPPYRIEGYDISNLMGTHTVASIVTFEGGRSKRSEYRKMRIRDLDKPDDFFSMHQAIYRRFTGSLADSMDPPDLLLIDGGKGQVSAARRALAEAGMTIPVVGLAKREETIITERGDEVIVPITHPGLKLLVNIRDEAHRTAVGYNRQRRGKAMTTSVLDDVPGIGPKRRDAILAHFSSVDQIRGASLDDLASIPGVGPTAARAIKDFFADDDDAADAAPDSDATDGARPPRSRSTMTQDPAGAERPTSEAAPLESA